MDSKIQWKMFDREHDYCWMLDDDPATSNPIVERTLKMPTEYNCFDKRVHRNKKSELHNSASWVENSSWPKPHHPKTLRHNKSITCHLDFRQENADQHSN